MHRFMMIPLLSACPGGTGSTTTSTTPTTPPTGDTAPPLDTSTTPKRTGPLAEAVDLSRMLAHLDALQAVADAQSSNRSVVTPGYDASADYVVEQLEGFGYAVRREAVLVNVYVNDGAELAQVAPTSQDYVAGTDFLVSPFSGSGTVEAPIVAVDAVIPPGPKANTSTAGCEKVDFTGFPAGAVALVQRGTCAFATKYANAVAAKASAVIFFNEGQKGRTAPLAAQIAAGALGPVPSVGIGYALGEELAMAEGAVVSLQVQGQVLTGADDNVFAETPGDGSSVVMAGAHLDSVLQGPGINDNASGTAFVLELARLFSLRQAPTQQVRFAFWGAEESGLLGSAAWLTDPSTGGADKAKLAALSAYLNFDMMASPNGARFVFDGDQSDFGGVPVVPGSAAIEQIYADWFAARGLATAPVSLLLPSDSVWFVLNGVPTGGVFTGASLLKTKAQAATFGGTAAEAYDACYHQSCDTRSNVDEGLYEELARASAHVVETLADDARRAARGEGAGFPAPIATIPVGCHDHVVHPR
ncbi:MAG: M28 family peptidase [Myxococcales bacterium]|nr:M28 family peptidase [Myxococcales bacterium]